MAKRLFDILVSAAALGIVAPVILLAAVGIRLSSRGPIFYRARRVGRNGEPFTMLKLRTMRIDQGAAPSAITGARDPRVFFFGALLRVLKIDELPQFYDVLRGKMSLVGPRPEDPRIVRDHYAPEHHETLRIRPGLTSPGSLFGYTQGDAFLADADPERAYVEKLLPVKLALEAVYVREANFWYDLTILARTALVIVLIACGRRRFRDQPEMRRLGRIVPARIPAFPDISARRTPAAEEPAIAGPCNQNQLISVRLAGQSVPTAG